MAAQALGPGTTIVRRRAFFGLLDAGGWAWATLKAAFWFVGLSMLASGAVLAVFGEETHPRLGPAMRAGLPGPRGTPPR